MSLILNIETATTDCSVALGRDDALVRTIRLDEGYTHAENLHVFIEKILREERVDPDDLSTVAVSQGPGSYTGLRIGTAAAKGLAFALNVPLIAIDTLQVMAAMALKRNGGDFIYRALIDARRMEVYTAAYDRELKRIHAPEALIVDDNSIRSLSTASRPVCFFGNALAKCRPVLSAIGGAVFLEGIVPEAEFMIPLSRAKLHAGQFEDLASYEPLYLKDFLIKPSKNVLGRG